MYRINRQPLHWLIALCLIAVGVLMGDLLGEQDAWINLRYQIYQNIDKISIKPVYAKRTAVVLIEDDEYWKGELARRVPIKRTYLAKLLRRIAEAEPAVIALDFDLRSPTIDGSMIEHPDYQQETAKFIQAIHDVAARYPVVLPITIGFDHSGKYILEPAVFDGPLLRDRHVLTGYISLPSDLRCVPYPLRLASGVFQDSFASAMVRAAGDTRALSLGADTSVPYGTFITRDGFTGRRHSSSDILNESVEAVRDKLGHKIVIIGAAWSKWAYGRGEPVDSYLSPIGFVGGVFLHANYVEAMLDSRIYRPLSKTAAILIEVLLSLGVALVFALEIRPVFKAMNVVAVCTLVIVIAYVFWQNLGLFFDFFIPIVLLASHATVEQIIEWRTVARSRA